MGRECTATASFPINLFPTGSTSTVMSPLVAESGFNVNAIERYIITGAIPGGRDGLNVSFDARAAGSPIPEPSTYAAMVGLAALGVAAWRRRRHRKA